MIQHPYAKELDARALRVWLQECAPLIVRANPGLSAHEQAAMLLAADRQAMLEFCREEGLSTENWLKPTWEQARRAIDVARARS